MSSNNRIKIADMAKKLLLYFFCLFFSIMMLPVTPSKADMYDSIPYGSYSHQKGQVSLNSIPNKAIYIPERVIAGYNLGLESLNNPTSLFCDKNNQTYVLESGSGRILILDSEYNLVKELSVFSYNGQTLDITGALGLFVNGAGEIFISDTENKRILISDISGNVTKILILPVSELIPPQFNFVPIKAIQDTRGFVYVLSKGSFYGAMIYSPNGEFLGFYGANRVAGTIFTAFAKLNDLLFGNNIKRGNQVQKLPFEFNDICIDSTNFIYTVTEKTVTSAGQIKKLSPGGENVLTYKLNYRSSSAEYYQFIDSGGFIRDNGTMIRNTFCSISIDDDGYMYALDSTYGKVFVYDSDCNLITVFGGGIGEGIQKGTFITASSIVVNRNDVIVSDSVKGTLTIFSLTDFGMTVKEADTKTIAGDYIASKPLWEEVLQQDKFFQLGYRGLAKAEMSEGDYKQSLYYARTGFDKDTYALAFENLRRNFLNDNFAIIFILAILLIGGLAFLISYSTKHKEFVIIKNRKTRIMILSAIHPFENFPLVKYEKQGSLLLSVLVLFVLYLVSTISDVYGGFMYNTFDPYTYNALYTLLGTAGVLVLWVIANWGINVLFEGKGKMDDIFIVSCYSLIPIILSRSLFLVLSQFLVPNESAILGIIASVGNYAMIIIMVFGMMIVHEYNFPKSIATSFLSVLGMGLIAFLIVLVLTLFQDLVSFFLGLFWEITLRLA